MKSASSRIVFEYWDRLRGTRTAPERGEIEPGEIREALADCFLLDFEDGAARFRLAGTRLSALFGRELKGEDFENLFGDDAGREDMRRLLATVTGESAGAVAGFVGETADGRRAHLELILLPLRHDGRTHARILGALSPRIVPPWLGLRALARVKMISVQMLWPRGRLSHFAKTVALRAGLVVVQGGRH